MKFYVLDPSTPNQLGGGGRAGGGGGGGGGVFSPLPRKVAANYRVRKGRVQVLPAEQWRPSSFQTWRRSGTLAVWEFSKSEIVGGLSW